MKWFPWELNSPVDPGLEHGRMPRWIFPCITAFLSAMTSAPNESKLSSLCLKHTCAGDIWFLSEYIINVTSSAFGVSNHGIIENRFYLAPTKTWPSVSLPTPPSSLRPCLQHAPWQCESMRGGIWETKGQPHDVSHADSDRQEPALVCVQRCHHYRVPGQRSWLVNTSCICLCTYTFCPSAGSNLIQTMALLCHG